MTQDLLKLIKNLKISDKPDCYHIAVKSPDKKKVVECASYIDSNPFITEDRGQYIWISYPILYRNLEKYQQIVKVFGFVPDIFQVRR